MIRYTVRTMGEFRTVEDIENAVVAYKRPGGSADAAKPVLLKDIAEVSDDFEDTGGRVYINGKPGIYLSVQKQSGTNAIAVADRVLKRVDELNSNGTLPAGTRMFVVRNETTQTKASLNPVFSTAYQEDTGSHYPVSVPEAGKDNFHSCTFNTDFNSCDNNRNVLFRDKPQHTFAYRARAWCRDDGGQLNSCA